MLSNAEMCRIYQLCLAITYSDLLIITEFSPFYRTFVLTVVGDSELQQVQHILYYY